MVLNIKRYLSAYNEYCEVSVEEAYINIKLIIGNRESGTGNWFLVPYLSKRVGYFKTIYSKMSLLRPLEIKTTSLLRPAFSSPKWYFP